MLIFPHFDYKNSKILDHNIREMGRPKRKVPQIKSQIKQERKKKMYLVPPICENYN